MDSLKERKGFVGRSTRKAPLKATEIERGNENVSEMTLYFFLKGLFL